MELHNVYEACTVTELSHLMLTQDFETFGREETDWYNYGTYW